MEKAIDIKTEKREAGQHQVLLLWAMGEIPELYKIMATDAELETLLKLNGKHVGSNLEKKDGPSWEYVREAVTSVEDNPEPEFGVVGKWISCRCDAGPPQTLNGDWTIVSTGMVVLDTTGFALELARQFTGGA